MRGYARLLVLIVLAVLIVFVGAVAEAHAAKGRMTVSSSHSDDSGERHIGSVGGRQDMLLDLSVHYVRDTKQDGGTDSAGRFSVGGMFNEWIGLDLQGLYEVRSKSYLVGADFRFVPNDWFFLKGGVGGYSNKATHELSLTPTGGAGIMARLTKEFYLLTEAAYFNINDRNNISFGVGLGVIF